MRNMHIPFDQKRFVGAVLVLSLLLCSGCSKEEPIEFVDPVSTDTGASPVADTADPSADVTCEAPEDCGDKYCVKGFCRAWECEDHADCAASGPLARCDEGTFRCVICAEDDRACLEVDCIGDADCSDLDPCTEDQCDANNACIFTEIDGCCDDDNQCDDGVACTIDRCKQGMCSSVPEDNLCCVNDDHCGDGNPCTTDLCLDFRCIHPNNSADGDCGCAVYLECDDTNPCTEDLCVNGTCLHTALSPEAMAAASTDGGATCCGTDIDCSDEDESTFERCFHQQCQSADAAECSADSECAGEGPCTESACASGHCVMEVLDTAGCCTTATDCAASTQCTASTCENNTCGESPSDDPDILWSENFDAGGTDPASLGWTIDNDGSGAYWQIAEKLYSSLPASLCFGVTGCTSYAVSTSTSGHATSPEVTLPSDRIPRLKFDIATDIEPGVGGTAPSTQKDWVYVDILPKNGSATPIFDKKDMLPTTDTNLGWMTFELSLEAFKGQTIQVRFGFDTRDALDNNHQGVFVDEVKVTLDCPL